MFTAEAVEGWVDALIPVGETDLMLVLDLSWIDPRITRYFELEPSASITPGGAIFNQAPNDLGAGADQPAAIGEKMIMPEWDVTVNASMRGPEALALLRQNAPDFSGPEEGEEFILLNVVIHFFGSVDLPMSLSDYNFYVMVDDDRYNGRVRYPRPTDLNWINNIIFPGAAAEGWTIVAIPEGLANPVFAFDPGEYNGDQSPEGVRFFKVP